MKLKTIALIPARKGSKRVPGKNTKLLGDKKLIEYTIDHAIKSKLIDQVFISSDDLSIKTMAGEYGCSFIQRNSDLSGDKATTKAVIDNFLSENFNESCIPENLILLQPNVPFRRITLSDEAIKLLSTDKYDSVTSHIKVDFYHPNRLKLIEGNYLVPYKEIENEEISREELENVYCRDGAVYAFKVDSYLKTHSILGIRQGFIINDAETLVNIDTFRDWYVAEALLKEIYF